MSNAGGYGLVPPIAVGLLLPMGLLLVERSRIPQLKPVYLDYAVRLLIPAFAAWWPSLAFKERIEGNGRELLYFLRRKGESVTALLIGLVYCLMLIPFASVALTRAQFAPTSLYLLIARCLFVTALTFFAAFALQSGVLALVLTVAVNLVVMSPMENAIDTSALVSSTTGVGSAYAVGAVYVLLSAGLFCLGEMRSRRFTP